jgi:hypothetical protein
MKNDTIQKWIFWACCSHDTDNVRYWRKKTLIESRQLDNIVSNFDNLYSEAIAFLEKLTMKDLEMAVRFKN